MSNIMDIYITHKAFLPSQRHSDLKIWTVIFSFDYFGEEERDDSVQSSNSERRNKLVQQLNEAV